MELNLDFQTNPPAAARAVAAQLGDSDANNLAWHRAAQELDAVYVAKLDAARTERNPEARARLMRESEHARRTRSVLATLYYIPWRELAAQIANPPTDPVEPDPSAPPTTAAPSPSRPIRSEAEAEAEAAKAKQIIKEAVNTVRSDIRMYREKQTKGTKTTRNFVAIASALAKNAATDAAAHVRTQAELDAAHERIDLVQASAHERLNAGEKYMQAVGDAVRSIIAHLAAREGQS